MARASRFVATEPMLQNDDAPVLCEPILRALENGIKECQLDLLAGRVSTARMRANQLHRRPTDRVGQARARRVDDRLYGTSNLQIRTCSVMMMPSAQSPRASA